MYEKFKLPIARAEAEFIYRCYAPPEMFVKEFTDMPKEMQDAFNQNKISIECGGGGVVGPGCENCGFGEVEEWC